MLKKSYVLFLAVMAALFVVSCQDSSLSELSDEVEYLPARTEKDGRWGMVGSDGKLLFEDEFENMPSAVVNGYFSVKEGDFYSLYSASAKPALVKGCDDLTAVGLFRDGVIPLVHEKQRITFVDGKGKVKATLNPINGKEIAGCFAYPTEGLFGILTEDGKAGFVDKSGKIVIKPVYDRVYPFSEGVSIVVKTTDDKDHYIAIDKKGKELFRLKNGLDPVSKVFFDGLMVAKNSDEQYGFVDKKGEFKKVKKKVKKIGDYNKTHYAFKDDEYKWGVMDMNGEIVVRAKYNSVAVLPDGNFLVEDDDEYELLDKKGEKIITIDDYRKIVPIKMGDFAFIAKEKSTCVLLDKNGKPVGKEEFADISYDLTTSWNITSDYVNYDAALKAFLENLTDKGIKGYYVNMPVDKLGIKDYSDYAYEYNYYIPDLGKEGWRYGVSFGVRMNDYIAKREYYDNSSRVVRNPDAKVESIYIHLSTDASCWDDLKEKIISIIKAKGYEVDDESDNEVIFTGKNCTLRLFADSSGDIYILISDKSRG